MVDWYRYDDDDLDYFDPNPRDLPCPSCGRPNQLTPLERARGDKCEACKESR